MPEPRAFGPDDLRKARALADELMASSEPNKYWEQLDELTSAECKALDSIAFECTTCNHWFPVTEQYEREGQLVCRDCDDN